MWNGIIRRTYASTRTPRTTLRLTQGRRLTIGDHASIHKSFTREEVSEFCKMSMDGNSIHQSQESAQSQGLEDTIVPGFLSSSLIAGVIGTKLPGEGSLYASQYIEYKSPLLVGKQKPSRHLLNQAVHE
ncbi:MaoC domain protein [Planoprotostelium fungivorum]|uniref:MaoC domain protein n=1 Tax=Planoprotostelium fungivorum TaxID=1890364 RepID=A0A2P6NA11_9EUKA|nr:MaoC domain protein [Planoprotostelium fungivorum]